MIYMVCPYFSVFVGSSLFLFCCFLVFFVFFFLCFPSLASLTLKEKQEKNKREDTSKMRKKDIFWGAGGGGVWGCWPVCGQKPCEGNKVKTLYNKVIFLWLLLPKQQQNNKITNNNKQQKQQTTNNKQQTTNNKQQQQNNIQLK